MAVRVVEGKKPYTGGKAIEVTDEKVINLRLREENNLIIYDEGDDEIYVDLQLRDGIRPLDAFPVGVNTGRVLIADDWDVTGTIICAMTTSGDNIKILYGDDGTLWIDNGTGTFKQIYFKADVDLIAQRLQSQIDILYSLGKFLSLWDCVDGEPMSFPLTIPYEYNTGDWFMIGNVSSAEPAVNYRPVGDERDDTPSTTQETESIDIGDVYIYDGNVWLLQHNKLPVGSGNVIGPDSATDGHLAVFDGATGKIIKDGGPIPEGDTIEYVTQTEYDNLPASKTSDGKHYFIYSFPIIPVTGVTLNESSISLTTVGDTYQLTATVSPNDATNKSVTWNSSDTTIATVSQSGLVTCVTPGTATITVTTTDGGFTATCGVDAGGWQPGANTIAYRPLNSTDTVNDMKGSGTAYNLSGTATFGIDEGVDCYQSRSYSTMLTTANSLLYGNSNFTVNYWILEKETSTYHQHVFLSGGNGQRQQLLMWINSSNNHIMCGQFYEDYDTGYTITAGDWINVCITYNGTAMKIYINGNLELTQNISFGITSSGETSLGDSSLGGSDQYFRGDMSETFLENKVWTAQEITDYYNQTKGDYGIS